MNIILVDDEKKFINMLAKRLAMRGLKADVAFSGNEAIEKVTQTTYDLAVLDIKMPGISGVQLRNELSQIDPDLKFIFVTGHGAITQSEKNCMEKDVYLSKPLDIKILIEQIHQMSK